MIELQIHPRFSAPPEKVFAAVTDHRSRNGKKARG
jgi:uncharacterized protein YndB with AHSA1/START domain